jgi:Cu/Ag efflux protein CusF
MDRKWIAGAATLAVMALSGMTGQAVSVQAQSTKPGTMPGTMKDLAAEGRVVTVKGEQITLDNGTELTVPKSQAQAQELKQGTKIKATYEERAGKKVVNSLQIIAGPQTK